MSLKDKVTIKKYTKALQGISEIYNNANLKKRHTYLYPLRNAGLSFLETKNLGFNVTSWSWKQCLNRNDRKKGGRKALHESIEAKINSYMESKSSIAANRFLKKLDKNAYYCNIPLLEAYSKFDYTQDSGKPISFGTFYKYTGKQFKKAHRFSDLCDYCEKYKV